jgi:3-oxoacyl-(acyl-carrier-protein) synthase
MSRPSLPHLLAQNPIVVTGTGVISAAGDSVPALWHAVAAGRVPAVHRPFPQHDHVRNFPVCPALTLDPTQPAMHLVRRMDRCAQLAWHAARNAYAAAALESIADPHRIGLMLGTSRGPLDKLREGFARLDDRRYPPSLSADCSLASLSGVLAQGLKARGPTATISATCASGAFAIALAAEQILLGKADVMLAGGAEAPLNLLMLTQLDAAGVLGTHDDPARACRPFDITRNGLCLGEGSAFLVLESADHAAQRRAPVAAQLSGWALGVDASGRAGLDPTGAGLAQILRDALRTANLQPDDIDAVNAHGTGTQLNDLTEARALTAALGTRAATVPCTSTKPVTGHCLGATAALEAVICIESLTHRLIPPTANCSHLDPQCPLHVPTSPLEAPRLRHLLSPSLGFWGYQSALIFSTPSP